jgi:beta-phosphoglucomutase-like phosphatase (HAD superfamily)
MSYRRFATAALGALPAGTFAAVVTGDEVGPGKPHPKPYITAAELLGVPVGECIAIEDSEPGVASAEAAGCRVLVVPHHVDIDPTPYRRIVASLAGLTMSDLAFLFEEPTVTS